MKSTASNLSLVPVEPIVRLQPPADLESEEAALWRRIVEAKPADYFGDESAPVLAEYVRASVMADLLDKQVKAAIAGGEASEIKSMLQLRDMESKRVLSIATKLRLTNQSRYTPQAAATASKKASG